MLVSATNSRNMVESVARCLVGSYKVVGVTLRDNGNEWAESITDTGTARSDQVKWIQKMLMILLNSKSLCFLLELCTIIKCALHWVSSRSMSAWLCKVRSEAWRSYIIMSSFLDLLKTQFCFPYLVVDLPY